MVYYVVVVNRKFMPSAYATNRLSVPTSSDCECFKINHFRIDYRQR